MKFTQGFYINGEYFDAPIVSVKRKAPSLDKYAQRTEDGDLHREEIGVYVNYEMALGNESDYPDGVYQHLWETLTAANEFIDVTIPEFGSSVTFRCYNSEVDDEWDRVEPDRIYYKNLTLEFVAKKPRNTP